MDHAELVYCLTFLHNQRRRQQGASDSRPPHLKYATHFMFGLQLLHTSNVVFKKCASPLVAKSWRRACPQQSATYAHMALNNEHSELD